MPDSLHSPTTSSPQISRVVALILAGGTGERISGSKPKQYLQYGGESILRHTLRAFAPHVDDILVVCQPEWRNESAPYRSVDLYSVLKDCDIVIDGHSHTVMEAGPDGEKIQSTGTAFANVGVVVIDKATKTIEKNYLIAVTETTPTDAAVAAAAKAISDRVDAEYGQVFAKSEVKVWECRNCGHIVVGLEAPELCPVCAHPQAYFEVNAENY